MEEPPLQSLPPTLPPLHRDDSAEVDVYNPGKNEWDKIPSMNQVSLPAWEAQAALGRRVLRRPHVQRPWGMASPVPRTRSQLLWLLLSEQADNRGDKVRQDVFGG